MFIHFTFKDGSNPYIAVTEKTLFKCVLNWDLEFIGEESFLVLGHKKPYRKTYSAIKNILRDFAIEWQYDFADRNYSWGEIGFWESFFEDYGEKYGLLHEFKENGIV